MVHEFLDVRGFAVLVVDIERLLVDVDDTITGSPSADLIFGEYGVDEIHGSAGDDSIEGGAGNGDIDGEDGIDTISGGSGTHDIADNVSGNVTITGDAVSSVRGDSITEATDGVLLRGSDSADSFDASAATVAVETRAGAGNDTVTGSAGNDVIFGDDVITGGIEDDSIDGGADNDTLPGGGQADVLLGEDGSDRVRGQSGDDTVSGAGNRSVLVTPGDNADGGSGTNVVDDAFDFDALLNLLD